MRKWSYGAYLVLTVAAAPIASQAAEQAKQSNAATSVEEVMVTAQRREERLFEVPISITALTSDAIKDAGIVSTRELTTLTPGLNAATQGFALQPSIRGVTSTSTTLGDETNVAIYVDNVYLPFQVGNSFNLGAVERIEVLKGPQGTLFGRNATGGAIRVITEAPSFDPKLDVSADYGFDLKSREIEAYGSTRLTDNLAGSLTLYAYKDDGYVKNLTPGLGKVADTDQFSARAKLLWRVTDDARITLAFNHTNFNNSAGFSTAVVDGVNAFKNIPGAILVDAHASPYTVALNFNPKVKTLATGGHVRGEWDVGNVRLASTTSYNEYYLKALLDSDRTNLNLARFLIVQQNKILTQEFEAASDLDGPFNYSLGIFYFRNNAEAPTPTSYSQIIATSWAAFGEVYYDVNEHLRLIGGYRYTDEEKDGEASTAASRYSQKGGWNNSSWRATIQYKFNANHNIYASYSTGFKSGTISIAPIKVATQEVEPETVNAFEVGLRSRIGPLNISAAAFHYDYKNIQVQINNINAIPPAPTTLIQNAAVAVIEGAELQVGGRFNENWSGQVGISWLPTARYDEYKGGLTLVPRANGLGAVLTAIDLSGTRLIRTPEFTINGTLSYEAKLYDGTIRASGTAFYSDGFLYVAGGAVQQKAYTTVNARLAWTTPDERVTFSLWGHNLTDTFYFLQMGANTVGFTGSYAQPRVIGVGVAFSY